MDLINSIRGNFREQYPKYAAKNKSAPASFVSQSASVNFVSQSDPVLKSGYPDYDIFQRNTDLPISQDSKLAFKNPEQFINMYSNPMIIENALDANPNIAKILEENGLPVDYYLQNITSITNSHLIPTANKALEIYKNLGHEISEDNCLYLMEAALLHDIGKVFIPPEILNKEGKLTPKERQILELHNKLSYEILTTTNLNPKVARLAYEHHNYGNNVKPNDENQALTMADIYSALQEERPYKEAYSDTTTRAIMYDAGNKGKFDLRYMPYLQF